MSFFFFDQIEHSLESTTISLSRAKSEAERHEIVDRIRRSTRRAERKTTK